MNIIIGISWPFANGELHIGHAASSLPGDVIARYPKLADKVKLLGEYAKDKKYKEIDDPWGYSFEVYEKCAKEIVDSVEGFIGKEL